MALYDIAMFIFVQSQRLSANTVHTPAATLDSLMRNVTDSVPGGQTVEVTWNDIWVTSEVSRI